MCIRDSNKGIDEGAKLLTGGAEAPEGLEKGYFVRPTVFSEVTNDMTIAREEIFGPVLSIIPYDTEEEAVAIANDTDYGLAGAVWAGTRPTPSRWRAVCAPARSRSTGVGSTPWPPSAATSSPATVGSSGPSASRSISRSSPSSSDRARARGGRRPLRGHRPS